MVLQSIRDRLTGVLAFVILGLLVIPFAFVGVNEYFSSGSLNQVALVNDEEITFDQFNQSFLNYRRQRQQQLGAAFDPEAFDGLIARLEHLDRMIDEELLRQAAVALGYDVDNTLLAEQIRTIPAFQVDGVFNSDVYQARLLAEGLTISQFEQQLRQAAIMETLPRGILESSFATPLEAERLIGLLQQQRGFDAVTVPADPASIDTEFSDDEIAGWFADNQQRFMTEEQLTIEYLELNADRFPPAEAPDEAVLQASYEAQKGRFLVPEQREVSHILIEVPATASSTELEQGRLEAEVLSQRAKAGEDFATLAMDNSEDIGSASAGGSLGLLEQGIMPEAFEAAVYDLTLADPISEPIQTGFGWHVILLTGIEPASGMDFEAAREVLLEEAQQEQAERQFLEFADRLVDIVYEDPTTLEAASLDLELDIQTEGPFTRAGGFGVSAEPAVLSAAFSDLVLEQGSASDLIELSPTRAVVLRVLEHEPVRAQTLDEVREQVLALLRQERAEALARAQADSMLARVAAGEELAAVAEEAGLIVVNVAAARRQTMSPDPVAVQNVFKLPRPAEDSPGYHVVDAANGSALIILRSVTDGEVDEASGFGSAQAGQMMGTVVGSVESNALIQQLREAASVSIFEDRLGVSR